ncbi:CsgE family curli-type amyloid fiber assembly protein [Flavobacterium poyangense]|uniref:CsgE family curli-type amyloid fiber assembly protein n=1 Tax=Flavobacterium poyangense TaxID=2204302 RepID=UPI001FBA7E41|nr:CsgE family curli-type amyloid fiber assembly protein [Flavobacterium sp. JXAS1]
MSFLFRYMLLYFLCFSLVVTGQVTQNQIKAKIDVEKIENNFKITGMAENLTDVLKSASYRLSVIKNNNNSDNQSNNAQIGLFTLEPNEVKKLSTTQVNISPDDEIIILLLFYDEDKQIIAKDRVVLGNEKKKDDVLILPPDDGFTLRGIITDDTKTKMGKDFYDKYYYKYNDIGINAKKIVVITEEYSFGRNTKITISIQNEVVYEFLVRPDDEFLEAVAQESINATIYYLKNLERQSKYFTQY